jgi:hypothetical protein
MRKHKHTAATSDYLLPQNYVYTCQVLNHIPTDADPLKQLRSPLQIWLNAPFQHRTQPVVPWACRSFGFVGKTTVAPNTGMRSRPGLNLGHASNTSGYLVYHPDTDTVLTYGYTKYDTNKFPMRDMLLAGELHSKDGSIDPDGWRQHAIKAVQDIDDSSCANFLSGKQVQFWLPVSANPTFQGRWRARAHRPVITNNGPIGLKIQFTHYDGPISDLKTKTDREYASRPVLGIMLMSPLLPHQTLPSGWYSTTARSCLLDTFPTCRTLADIAIQSVSLTGSFPQPKAMGTHADQFTLSAIPVSNEFYPRGRIVIPVRKIRSVRTVSATWSSSHHQLLRTRTQYVRPPATAGAAASTIKPHPKEHTPPCFLSLKPGEHLGFCPRSIKEARKHESWLITSRERVGHDRA